jgi:hypothetical protein
MNKKSGDAYAHANTIPPIIAGSLAHVFQRKNILGCFRNIDRGAASRSISAARGNRALEKKRSRPIWRECERCRSLARPRPPSRSPLVDPKKTCAHMENRRAATQERERRKGKPQKRRRSASPPPPPKILDSRVRGEKRHGGKGAQEN